MKRILIDFTVLLLLSTAGYAVVTWRGKQARASYDTARQAEVSGIQLTEQQLASSQASFDKLRAGANADELAARAGDRGAASWSPSPLDLDWLDGDRQLPD